MNREDTVIPSTASTTPRVLIVEDTTLVSLLIETMIEDMGWSVAGPAARLSEALTAARTEAIDVAIVDVNLNGEASWEVASILRDRGVPYIFTTGYSDAANLPPNLAGSPVMGKPFQVRDLEEWLRNAVPS